MTQILCKCDINRAKWPGSHKLTLKNGTHQANCPQVYRRQGPAQANSHQSRSQVHCRTKLCCWYQKSSSLSVLLSLLIFIALGQSPFVKFVAIRRALNYSSASYPSSGLFVKLPKRQSPIFASNHLPLQPFKKLLKPIWWAYLKTLICVLSMPSASPYFRGTCSWLEELGARDLDPRY